MVVLRPRHQHVTSSIMMAWCGSVARDADREVLTDADIDAAGSRSPRSPPTSSVIDAQRSTKCAVSVYTNTMTRAATLIHEARRDAGLSLRALANRSDVSYTTICRIERGHIDPTTSTLRKLLNALGEDLELGRRRAIPTSELAALANAWHLDLAGEVQPDWTRLRSFVDYLTRRPQDAIAAIATKPQGSGSDFFDNLLAGMAEKISDDSGVARPAWTRRIRSLIDPWESIGTPRMRAAAATSTPPQFAARKIFIPAATLWRQN